jgi:hypothetical protein
MLSVYGIGFTIGKVGITVTLYAIFHHAWVKYYVEGTTLDVLPFLGHEE